MNFTKTNLKWAQKVLSVAVFVFCMEILLPHFVLAGQIDMEEPGKGPVLVLLKQYRTQDDNNELVDQIVDLDELNQSEPQMVRYITVTAYSSTPDQTDDTPFITANGKYVYDGLVATNCLKFGTKVKFPEYFGGKVFTVDDRMNARYCWHMDVWFPTRQEAKEFGVKYLKMEVY